MTIRLCLGVPNGPPCWELTTSSRCAECARIVEGNRTRTKRERRPAVDQAERERRATAVREHVAQHGWRCPGWGRAAHTSTDLTADHVHAVAAGGAEGGPLAVLCRSCNGTKGSRSATPDDDSTSPGLD
jgi:hypothetical protein